MSILNKDIVNWMNRDYNKACRFLSNIFLFDAEKIYLSDLLLELGWVESKNAARKLIVSNSIRVSGGFFVPIPNCKKINSDCEITRKNLLDGITITLGKKGSHYFTWVAQLWVSAVYLGRLHEYEYETAD